MFQPNAAEWRRSTRCESGACVEVRRLGDEVQLRNSTRPEHSLGFSREAWREFRQGVLVGEFDLTA
jgi:hypothetical protein